MTMNIPATGKALLLAFLIAAPSILTGCKMKSGGKASEDSIFNLPEGQAPGALRIDSIYCRDPFIVADEASKTYYLYRSVPVKESGNGRGAVEAFASKDLENWYGPERVFTVPEDNSLTGVVWAPEVHRYKGSWYIFATLNTDRTWAESVDGWPPFTYRGTQTFKADSPEGPFLPLAKEPVTPKDFMALDGTLWVEDGIPYMIFCHEWVQIVDGTFDAMPLKEDLSAAAGDPVTLFKASDAAWTSPVALWTEQDGSKREAYVSDGNFVYRTKDGELLILWSSMEDGRYCVAISRSESGTLAGPWKCDDEPIFREDGGHPMVFKDFDGGLHLLIHQPNSGFCHPVILDLEDTGRTLVIKDTTDKPA